MDLSGRRRRCDLLRAWDVCGVAMEAFCLTRERGTAGEAGEDEDNIPRCQCDARLISRWQVNTWNKEDRVAAFADAFTANKVVPRVSFRETVVQRLEVHS